MQHAFHRYVIVLVAFILSLGIFYRLPRLTFPPLSAHNVLDSSDVGNVPRVRNTTLGFQEIKVISLPQRTDKRDAWAVAASISNFSVNLVDGVDGATVSEKSLPYGMSMKPGIVGCWRAHMNVLQDIVARSVATTLIFEDDADWDVSLKSQLVQFALGSQWILENAADLSTPPRDPYSPYGDGWDILWLGNCAAKADESDSRRWIIEDDSTTDPLPLRMYGIGPDDNYWNSSTRLVFSQSYGVCTTSYAVSLAGAKKMLYHLSMSPFNSPIDLGLSELCEKKKSSFTCVGVWPPMIGVFRPEGKASGASDIETTENDHFEPAYAERIIFSTRLNMDRLLRGETRFRAANADQTRHPELEIEQIIRPVGTRAHFELSPLEAGRQGLTLSVDGFMATTDVDANK